MSEGGRGVRFDSFLEALSLLFSFDFDLAFAFASDLHALCRESLLLIQPLRSTHSKRSVSEEEARKAKGREKGKRSVRGL